MKQLKKDILWFLNNRMFVILLVLTAAGCYAFKLMHPAIGVDDTPYDYYFSEGLIVVVGRWVLFLLNRLLSIGRFAPFLTDFAGVLLLLAAAVLWSVVFKRIFGGAVPGWGYLVFACLFISNPLISEVFTYFLHNGIAIGYTFGALAALAFLEGLEGKGKRKPACFGISALCVWVSVGCYESFAVVFLVAAMLILLARRICGKKDAPVISILWTGAVLAAAVLLRSLMTHLMIAVFSLQDLQGEAVLRSLGEMLSWLTDAAGRAELVMAVKRAFVMYGVFAYQYLPIFMYVAACVTVVCYSVWRTIRQKDLWIAVYTAGVFAASWILILIEGKVTLYRACQFLPLFCAFAFLLLVYAGRKWYSRRAVTVICAVLAVTGIWNQTADMNKWFYVDHQKYEAAKDTMGQIALELERNHDISKPLIFVGVYDIPMEITEDAYVPIGSEKYWNMYRLTSVIDEHLLEKFYRRNHIWVAQTPTLSVIQWGMTAFDSNRQLVKFLEMHGHSFRAETDFGLIEQVGRDNQDMPAWPRQGSIREEEDYIIINFGY